jgi:transcription initiation factor TFIIB
MTEEYTQLQAQKQNETTDDDFVNLFLSWKFGVGTTDSSTLPDTIDTEPPTVTDCSFCGSKETCWVEEGYKVCHSCSKAEIGELETTAEWRYFSTDSSSKKTGDPSRVGLPVNPLVPNAGTGTIIERRNKETHYMRRIRRFHHWNSLNFQGRNLFAVFDKLQLNTKRFGIPPMIIEKAKLLFKRVNDNQLFRGENKEGLIATCIYQACKEHSVPRSVKEIATMFDIDEQCMTKGNRCFTQVIELSESTTLVVSKPVDFVERFASRLKISETYLPTFREVAMKVDEFHLIADNASSSIAAAIIFFVSEKLNLGTTKRCIASVSLVSDVTISKCYNKLLKYEVFLQNILDSQKVTSGTF